MVVDLKIQGMKEFNFIGRLVFFMLRIIFEFVRDFKWSETTELLPNDF